MKSLSRAATSRSKSLLGQAQGDVDLSVARKSRDRIIVVHSMNNASLEDIDDSK